MRGTNPTMLFCSPKNLLIVLTALIIFGAMALPSRAMANDLPLAAGSPLAGFTFDDRPLLLPVQRNFQMAMLTASSQIGRSCGRMEFYGWRMGQSEQKRVNLIFSNTVDRLRALGYTVEAQTPSSISKDITMFTADRAAKHFLFMWSAGEIGLVMVLCESSPPMTGHMAFYGTTATQLPPPPQDVLQSKLETPAPVRRGHNGKIIETPFTPYGDWVGDYTCLRGYTGATLHINKFKGEDFEGTFRFYPTSKNPYAPKGSYAVYGQYDHQSQRILINPGKWIEHPSGTYKTIIIGSFDPARRTFSGFFQGIMGCTSFEAKFDVKSREVAPRKTPASKAKKSKKKIVQKSSTKKVAPEQEILPMFAPEDTAPVPGDLKIPDNGSRTPPPVKTPPLPPVPPAPPVSAAPVPPLPLPPVPPAADAPVSIVPQGTTGESNVLPPAPAPAPAPAASPVPTPSDPASVAKPTSSLEPQHRPNVIILAGDNGCGASALSQLQPAATVSSEASQLQPAGTFANTANQLPAAQTQNSANTYMSNSVTQQSNATMFSNSAAQFQGIPSTAPQANTLPPSNSAFQAAPTFQPSNNQLPSAPCFTGAHIS